MNLTEPVGLIALVVAPATVLTLYDSSSGKALPLLLRHNYQPTNDVRAKKSFMATRLKEHNRALIVTMLQRREGLLF